MVRRVRVCVVLHVGLVKPGVEQRVVLGSRAEVPDDGVAVARDEREANQLVHGPRADVGSGHVTDVAEVERKEGTEVGFL